MLPAGGGTQRGSGAAMTGQSQSGPDAAALRAVLGPTNTGKTHLAVERMLGHRSGMIGLPLRLLAREIYDRVRARAGDSATALVTGEERIVPPGARYWVCTVEAMPLEREVDFLAVDEAQLCADPERGHVFTHRMLHARGTAETMLLGAETLGPLVRRLLPGVRTETRERFSALTWTGRQRLTALPRRSAVVAFSAAEVYAIAEILRRKRGGAAVVMGALSPRTRNAQVDLFQNGEVDFIVATDAIGMGLNLEIDHVAFASLSKFDGRKRRRLRPSEMGQIAGRAGRFRNRGTFGVTGDAPELEPDDIRRLETHSFKPLDHALWRNFALELSSVDALLASLAAPAPDPVLRRAGRALDEESLRALLDNAEIARAAAGEGGARLLWSVCQIPDFRNLGLDAHVRLLATVFGHLHRSGRLPPEFLGGQIARLDQPDGDVDALGARLAQIRTLAYLAHRDDWLGGDAAHWRERARDVEDRLSDALHQRLTQRFVDRRTSALLRGLRESRDLLSGVSAGGTVTVEGHEVGRVHGLRVTLDSGGGALEARALRNAAEKALRPEIGRRLGALARDTDDAFAFDAQNRVMWRGAPVARLVAGPDSAHPDSLAPGARLIGGEMGAAPARARAERRIEAWVRAEIARTLAPLLALETAVKEGSVSGLARGIAWRLREQLGSAPRRALAAETDALSAAERRALRRLGVRIGRFSLFVPALLKPAAVAMLARLHATRTGERPFLPAPGLTSTPLDARIAPGALAASGFRAAGPRAVRLDALEALGEAVEAARMEGEGRLFALTPAMTSQLGCSLDDLRGVLRALDYAPARKPGADGAPELWRRRGAGREGPRRGKAAPAPAHSPFAALEALRPAAAPPRPSHKNRKRRKRPARARAQAGNKTAGTE